MSRLKLGERSAERARLDPDIGKGGLDRDRVDLGEERVDERQGAQLKLAAACDRGLIETFEGDWLAKAVEKVEAL